MILHLCMLSFNQYDSITLFFFFFSKYFQFDEHKRGPISNFHRAWKIGTSTSLALERTIFLRAYPYIHPLNNWMIPAPIKSTLFPMSTSDPIELRYMGNGINEFLINIRCWTVHLSSNLWANATGVIDDDPQRNTSLES